MRTRHHRVGRLGPADRSRRCGPVGNHRRRRRRPLGPGDRTGHAETARPSPASISSMSPATYCTQTSPCAPHEATSGSTSASGARSTLISTPETWDSASPPSTTPISVGREVKWALNGHRLRPTPLQRSTQRYLRNDSVRRPGTDDGNLHQRNITVFAEGEVDRSPCGSGTGSRVAVRASAGQLKPGQTLTTTPSSALDSTPASSKRSAPASIPQWFPRSPAWPFAPASSAA